MPRHRSHECPGQRGLRRSSRRARRLSRADRPRQRRAALPRRARARRAGRGLHHPWRAQPALPPRGRRRRARPDRRDRLLPRPLDDHPRLRGRRHEPRAGRRDRPAHGRADDRGPPAARHPQRVPRQPHHRRRARARRARPRLLAARRRGLGRRADPPALRGRLAHPRGRARGRRRVGAVVHARRGRGVRRLPDLDGVRQAVRELQADGILRREGVVVGKMAAFGPPELLAHAPAPPGGRAPCGSATTAASA